MKLLICVGMLALACSKGGESPPPSEPATVQEPEPVAIPAAAPKCVNEQDEPVQCDTDADCCDGFVCGKDPEQSHRLKYCVFGG